ncbi:MAG: hypothetical protein ACOC8F_01335 [Planctomycetota bacterium]
MRQVAFLCVVAAAVGGRTIRRSVEFNRRYNRRTGAWRYQRGYPRGPGDLYRSIYH